MKDSLRFFKPTGDAVMCQHLCQLEAGRYQSKKDDGWAGCLWAAAQVCSAVLVTHTSHNAARKDGF